MSLNEQSRPSLARGVRVQTDRKTGELLLLFPEGVLHVSETAGDILNRCDGRSTVSTIISDLAAEYEAAPEIIRKDVLDSLLDLYQRKLVVF
jgi:pyrroloquinoline quinone biosynthesis protein D